MNTVQAQSWLAEQRTERARRELEYGTLGRQFREVLETTLRFWGGHGVIDSWNIRALEDARGVRVLLRYRDFIMSYVISDDELMMGRVESFLRWLATIRRDFEQRVHPGTLHSRHIVNPALDVRSYDRDVPLTAHEVLAQRSQYEEWRNGWLRDPTYDAAEQRAKDLFIAVAGEDAFKKLDSGKPVRLLGSAGGQYKLFKRSTYCVERDKDGAQLCAVVPGVPLWDHLLGIKLMVEHDEPRFSKTANVARPGPLPGGITWNEVNEIPRGIGERLRF